MGLNTWAIWATHTYTNTPPQSELPAQRSSRLENKKDIPRSLNNRRSGVQDWTTRKYTQGKYPPPQPQLATGYVEAGAELREGRGMKALGEDVGKLGGGRDMENPNIADGDPVVHKVQVDLHMFRPLMLDGVSGEIHVADVVAVDERALGERAVELRQELA